MGEICKNKSNSNGNLNWFGRKKLSLKASSIKSVYIRQRKIQFIQTHRWRYWNVFHIIKIKSNSTPDNGWNMSPLLYTRIQTTLTDQLMTSVFWDADETIFTDCHQKGASLNSDYYCTLLDRFFLIVLRTCWMTCYWVFGC